MTDPTPAEALATVLAHLQRGADRRGFIGGPSAADCRVASNEIRRLQEIGAPVSDPLDARLPHDVTINDVTFSKGTHLRTLVECVARWHTAEVVAQMLEHPAPACDEGQRRMNDAAEALFKIPAVAAKLHEFDVPRVPTRQAILIAAITAAVKAVEDMDREVGKTYGGSTSALGPFMIGVTVEKVK